MSHFAQLKDGVVHRVLVVEQDYINSGALGDPASWVQTSYNATIRKNFAGIGFSYDAGRDAFIPPQPYFSWNLNENTCRWEPPVKMPADGKMYAWDEKTKKWVSQ